MKENERKGKLKKEMREQIVYVYIYIYISCNIYVMLHIYNKYMYVNLQKIMEDCKWQKKYMCQRWCLLKYIQKFVCKPKLEYGGAVLKEDTFKALFSGLPWQSSS